MSARFFGFFAAVWLLAAFAAEWFGKGIREVTHFSILMAVLHLGFWSIMRKLDGKEPI